MKFGVTLDRDEDGIWISECPAVPGCVSQRSTRDEVLANIREVIGLYWHARSPEKPHTADYGSFRPDQQIRKLRNYMRLRDNLVVASTKLCTTCKRRSSK